MRMRVMLIGNSQVLGMRTRGGGGTYNIFIDS